MFLLTICFWTNHLSNVDLGFFAPQLGIEISNCVDSVGSALKGYKGLCAVWVMCCFSARVGVFTLYLRLVHFSVCILYILYI